jgi:hypothetical protein
MHTHMHTHAQVHASMHVPFFTHTHTYTHVGIHKQGNLVGRGKKRGLVTVTVYACVFWLLWASIASQPVISWHNLIGYVYTALQELQNDPLKLNSEKVKSSNIQNIYGIYGKYIYIRFIRRIYVDGNPIYGLGQPYIYDRTFDKNPCKKHHIHTVYIWFWPTLQMLSTPSKVLRKFIRVPYTWCLSPTLLLRATATLHEA